MRAPRPRSSAAAVQASPATLSIGPGVVLGIDPGTRVVGFGAVENSRRGKRLIEAGVIRCASKLAVPDRLAFIALELDRLLAKLKPRLVVVEQAFAAANVQSALRLGEGRGVVLACAARAACPVVQYPPAVAKRALAGNGAAPKAQVAGMVARLLDLDTSNLPWDATDALALALTAILRAGSPASSRAR